LSRPHEGAGFADAAELEWGKPGWMESRVAPLAANQPELIVAADCCYIDQAGDVGRHCCLTGRTTAACASCWPANSKKGGRMSICPATSAVHAGWSEPQHSGLCGDVCRAVRAQDAVLGGIRAASTRGKRTPHLACLHSQHDKLRGPIVTLHRLSYLNHHYRCEQPCWRKRTSASNM
jgi:hypothetical protein